MNIFRQYKYRLLVATLPAFLLAACGGSSMDDPMSTTAQLTLAITDAPVDGAAIVNIQVTGVEIKSASDMDNIDEDFNEPMNIDLLALQGGGSINLLENVTIEAGTYQWIRLKVNAERSVNDSYLLPLDDTGEPMEDIDVNRISLWIPSGNQTGLKLNHSFVVTAGGATNFTIDFDLRKSITNPVGQDDYFLKPSLRLVDNSEVGEISGEVDVFPQAGDGGRIFVPRLVGRCQFRPPKRGPALG